MKILIFNLLTNNENMDGIVENNTLIIKNNNYNILDEEEKDIGVAIIIITVSITLCCIYIIVEVYPKFSHIRYLNNINNVSSVLNTNHSIIDLDNLESININSNYLKNKKDTNISEININNMNCIICYDNIDMGFKFCDIISDHYYCLECIKRVENEFNNKCVICKINTGIKTYKST